MYRRLDDLHSQHAIPDGDGEGMSKRFAGRERGFSALAHGENADDPAHLRPGSKAVSGVRCVPSTEAGETHKGRRSWPFAISWVVYASGVLLFETHASEAHELRLWFYPAGLNPSGNVQTADLYLVAGLFAG